MRHANRLKNMMADSIKAKESFLNDEDKLKTFDEILTLIVEAYKKGGRLYLAGNGGSAADAQHVAAELVCRFAKNRKALPAEALTTDPSVMTAIGNDFGYEKVFSRQVEAKATPIDIFFGISTSGDSPNIISALKACKEVGCKSVLLSGKDGGEAAKLADHVLLADGESTSIIQEVHIVIEHALCASLESYADGE